MEFGSVPPRRLRIGRYVLLFLVLCIAVYFLVRNRPRPPKPPPPPILRRVALTLAPSDLLPEVLTRGGLGKGIADSVVSLLTAVQFDFRRCLPDDSLRFEFRDSVFLRLEYERSYDRVFVVARTPEGLSASMLWRPTRNVTGTVKGVIHSSLYQSVVDLGESPELVFDFTDVLQGEVDFLTESQPGDSFFIAVEKKMVDTVRVGYGPPRAVRYKGKAGDFVGVRFEASDGGVDYYDRRGQTLRRLFMRSPLHYRRISSFFSLSRFHPILRIVRPHRGVDYVAPSGTPVSALGDGRVAFAGRRGGYGNLVEISHPGGYRTRYGHLLRFASGVRGGTALDQGQVLGYVGSTGMSTGPHLHFEMARGGRYVNPLRLVTPPARTITSHDRPRYEADLRRLLEEMR